VVRTVRCVECEPNDSRAAVNTGSAGASAHREYERRRIAREVRVKAQLGDMIGGFALALAGEPQSTRAWERGSVGERKLAEALAGVEGLVVLHDRRAPKTRGNIDHIVIAPAGVFVVDAKRYAGLIQIRYRGGLFSRAERLYVGRRDCSDLATNMGWQIAAVRRALAAANAELSAVPVTPVLCFVDGEWPLLLPPESYKGVRVEGTRSIKKLVSGSSILDHDRIDRISRILASAFPAKQSPTIRAC
jgi:nuclease-like protein